MHWIDPRELAVMTGRVECLLYNPHGEADGLLLDDGREVHVPPHLGEQLRKNVRSGALFSVRGVKPRDCDMICAVSFGGDDGLAVVDEGPPERHDKPHPKHPDEHAGPISVDGEVRCFLHGAKGEVRGALLDNGVQLRWKKHDSELITQHVDVGDWLVAEGEACKLDDAIVVHVDRIAAREQRRSRPSA